MSWIFFCYICHETTFLSKKVSIHLSWRRDKTYLGLRVDGLCDGKTVITSKWSPTAKLAHISSVPFQKLFTKLPSIYGLIYIMQNSYVASSRNWLSHFYLWCINKHELWEFRRYFTESKWACNCSILFQITYQLNIKPQIPEKNVENSISIILCILEHNRNIR